MLPYRAGYETTDRHATQKALAHGTLAGVVFTSALELGLDIGDLDLVVLLNTPPTLKSFRQRIGRAGRRRLQQLFFPEGVAHDGTRFNRTAPTAPLFNYSSPAGSTDEDLVSRIFASWNHIGGWLLRLDGLRRVA